MEITQIRYFLKTAELLNYTRAAEALFITRQSLRQAIAAMEKELGQPLFVNVRNKLSLTEYGAYLAVAGAEVTGAYDRMQDGLRRLAARQTVLRVAFSHSLFPFMLPETESILRAFSARFPHILLDVQHMENDAVIDAAVQGGIDCGCVVQMPCERPGCAMRTLYRYPAAVDFCPASPLSGRRAIALADLDGQTLLGMGSLEKTLAPLDAACRAQGIRFAYRVEPSAIDAFYHIEHGHALGFDIFKQSPQDTDWSRTAQLTGFSWEIGFLCPGVCENKSARELFLSFLEEAYGARPGMQQD